MSARRGKVARLSREHRNLVNLGMDDGCTATAIIEALKDAGVKPEALPNADNLSSWRKGGFLEWKDQRLRLEEMKARREFAYEIARENEGSKIHEANLQVVASQIYEVFSDIDPAVLKAQVAADPQVYTRLVGRMAQISRSALEFQKFKDNVAERKAAIERELKGAVKNKGGISPETIARIERELNLL